MRRSAAALIGLLSTGAMLSADNWPAWRGSNDAGVSLEQLGRPIARMPAL